MYVHQCIYTCSLLRYIYHYRGRSEGGQGGHTHSSRGGGGECLNQINTKTKLLVTNFVSQFFPGIWG